MLSCGTEKGIEKITETDIKQNTEGKATPATRELAGGSGRGGGGTNVSCQLKFRLFVSMVSCRLNFWPFVSCQLTPSRPSCWSATSERLPNVKYWKKRAPFLGNFVRAVGLE